MKPCIVTTHLNRLVSINAVLTNENAYLGYAPMELLYRQTVFFTCDM